ATDKISDDLAERSKELLVKAGFKSVRQETLVKGGTQSTPIFNDYYISEIPVCQLSVKSNRDGSFHYNLGRALAALKDEGVLILGLTKHLVPLWDKAFDEWLSERLLNNRFNEEMIMEFEKRMDHNAQGLYPLFVALGAAGEGAIAERFHDG
ncbi:hypothetical protein KI387_005771, partial [Taxus chinensis]